MADEVKIVNILIPGDLPQRFQQDATLLQFVDYCLLLLLGVPGTEEGIQGGILAEDVLLGVVRHAFRDELAVLVVVLDTLIQDRDLDTTHPEFVLLFRRIVGVPTGARSRNGWLRWIGSRLFAGIIAIINDRDRVAIEFRVCEESAGIAKIHDGEILFAVVGLEACATTDDLLELGHGVYVVIQNDEPARFAVHASRHQLGGRNDHGVFAVLCDKVVELRLALGVVAGNTHDILGILRHEVAVFVHERLPHPLCMVDVHAEYDGLGKAVVFFQKASDTLRHGGGALIDNEVFVVILGVVLPVLDFVPVDVVLSSRGSPTFQVFVQADAENFVRSEEAIVDTLFQTVCIDGFTEVRDIGYLFRFLRRSSHTDLRGTVEVFEYSAPTGILLGAATVTLINDDEVEEIRLKCTERLFVLITSQLLIEGQVQFIGAVQLFALDFRHDLCKGLEVLLHGLVNENVAVSKEQDLFLATGFPKAVDDLKRSIGLAGTGRHNEEDTILPTGYCINGAVDGDTLIVARGLITRLKIVRLGDKLLLLRREVLVPNVSLPKILRRGKLLKRQLSLFPGLHIVFKETIAIRAVHKRNIQHLGVFDGLLHPGSDDVPVIFRLDDSQWNIGFVVEQIVSALSFASGSNITTDDNTTVREVVLHADLLLPVPASALNGWGNKLKFDVLLSHFMFFHKVAHANASFCCFR